MINISLPLLLWIVFEAAISLLFTRCLTSAVRFIFCVFLCLTHCSGQTAREQQRYCCFTHDSKRKLFWWFGGRYSKFYQQNLTMKYFHDRRIPAQSVHLASTISLSWEPAVRQIVHWSEHTVYCKYKIYLLFAQWWTQLIGGILPTYLQIKFYRFQLFLCWHNMNLLPWRYVLLKKIPTATIFQHSHASHL